MSLHPVLVGIGSLLISVDDGTTLAPSFILSKRLGVISEDIDDEVWENLREVGVAIAANAIEVTIETDLEMEEGTDGAL